MAALQQWKDQEEDLRAGRVPRGKAQGLTLQDLCNRFLTSKMRLRDNGELVHRTFDDYYRTCQRLIGFFGKTRLVSDLAADDFEQLRVELAKTRGPVALGSEITRVRVVMKYAHDQGSFRRLFDTASLFASRPSGCCSRHGTNEAPGCLSRHRFARCLTRRTRPSKR